MSTISETEQQTRGVEKEGNEMNGMNGMNEWDSGLDVSLGTKCDTEGGTVSNGIGMSIPCNMHHSIAKLSERALGAALQHVTLQLSTMSPMAWRGRIRLATRLVGDV